MPLNTHQSIFSPLTPAKRIRRILVIPELALEFFHVNRWHVDGIYATLYNTKRIKLDSSVNHLWLMMDFPRWLLKPLAMLDWNGGPGISLQLL